MVTNFHNFQEQTVPGKGEDRVLSQHPHRPHPLRHVQQRQRLRDVHPGGERYPAKARLLRGVGGHWRPSRRPRRTQVRDPQPQEPGDGARAGLRRFHGKVEGGNLINTAYLNYGLSGLRVNWTKYKGNNRY